MSLESIIAERVHALIKDGVVLQFQKDADGNWVPPSGAVFAFKFDFSVDELRQQGVTVRILNADGREVSDDEYASAVLAMQKRMGTAK